MAEMMTGFQRAEGLHATFETEWATIRRMPDRDDLPGPRYLLEYRGAPRAGKLVEELSENQADFATRGAREAYGVLLYARSLYQSTDPSAPVGSLPWYKHLRVAILRAKFTDDIPWSETLEAPTDADEFWRQFTNVVLNSGMNNRIAQGIYDRVRPAVEAGESAFSVFKHRGKAAAIDYIYTHRQQTLAGYLALDAGENEAKLEYLGALSWIGGITKFHLGKNLGLDVAKPDRHLERVVGEKGFAPVQTFCEKLAAASGDRVATVDLVIWRAATIGLLKGITG